MVILLQKQQKKIPKRTNKCTKYLQPCVTKCLEPAGPQSGFILKKAIIIFMTDVNIGECDR